MPARAVNGDFRMGGDESPPIGGGPMGGDKGPMGGDSRVIRDNIVGSKKVTLKTLKTSCKRCILFIITLFMNKIQYICDYKSK